MVPRYVGFDAVTGAHFSAQSKWQVLREAAFLCLCTCLPLRLDDASVPTQGKVREMAGLLTVAATPDTQPSFSKNNLAAVSSTEDSRALGGQQRQLWPCLAYYVAACTAGSA